MVPAWIAFILCFLGLPFHSEKVGDSPPIWWVIEISVSVSGSYQVEGNSTGLTGRYHFLIGGQGSMERDNGDYILYQGEKHVVNLNWNETRGGVASDVSQLMHPVFKLHYVVRKGKGIYLDFETFPVQAGGEYLPVRILLPCSDENSQINHRNRYNHYIIQGSNVIGVVEDRLYRENRIIEGFRWQWEKNEKGERQYHSVELELKITQKAK